MCKRQADLIEVGRTLLDRISQFVQIYQHVVHELITRLEEIEEVAAQASC